MIAVRKQYPILNEDRLRAEIAALKKKVAALKRDKKRLDWIESTGGDPESIGWRASSDIGVWRTYDQQDGDSPYFRSIRRAIDHAIQEGS